MKTFRAFLTKLKQTQEQGDSLLDRTMVFFSSNLGNASNHSPEEPADPSRRRRLPHGQHLAFDPDNPPPLCNLYVSMLQRTGHQCGQLRFQHRNIARPGNGAGDKDHTDRWIESR